MATKKKTRKAKKTSTRSKKSAARKSKPLRAKATQKRTSPANKKAKRAAAPKKAAAKKKALKKMKQTARPKAAGARTNKTANNQPQQVFGLPRDASRAPSGEESGDLQGLSNIESADSESVDELIEEGNAFEAGVVSGVEEAGRRGEREVHTREVPEDDVPGEYLDED
jgi:hypothetical protein